MAAGTLTIPFDAEGGIGFADVHYGVIAFKQGSKRDFAVGGFEKAALVNIGSEELRGVQDIDSVL